ncbi:hypothetical protein pb186bvf_001324 [Paramecium bursaria]
MANLQAVVSLDTGDKIEQIYIYEGDDIEVLAEFFCERHSIQPEGKSFIISQIQAQLYPSAETKRKHTANPSLVSLNSQQMIQKLQRNKTENDIYNYLHDEAWKQKQRREQAIEDHKSKQEKQITQKPQISKKSQEISQRQSRQTSQIHARLYEEQKSLSQKRQQNADIIFKKIHPFQPKPLAKWDKRPTRRDQSILADRLNKSKSISQQRLMAMRVESNSPIDKVTGQELFKPKIYKNRIFEKVSKKIDDDDQKTAIEIQQNVLNLQHLRKKKIFDNNYAKIKQKQDESQLEDIFYKLDDDNDGIISCQFINLNIDQKLLRRITPALIYMEDQNLILDVESFKQICHSQRIYL